MYHNLISECKIWTQFKMSDMFSGTGCHNISLLWRWEKPAIVSIKTIWHIRKCFPLSLQIEELSRRGFPSVYILAMKQSIVQPTRVRIGSCSNQWLSAGEEGGRKTLWWDALCMSNKLLLVCSCLWIIESGASTHNVWPTMLTDAGIG